MSSIFEQRSKSPNGSIFKQRAKTDEESFGKSLLRTGYQPIAGFLKRFTYPADIVKIMGAGEAVDPEFLEHLKAIHQREGLPFDEEEYFKKVSEAVKAMPTQEGLEELIEEKTGLPLAAKTGLQKTFRFGGTAAGFQSGSLIQKAIAGVTAPAISETAQALGIPEPLADILGLTASSGAATSKIAERVLTPEQQALRQIAGKHELPTYAGMDVEKPPKVTPVVSKGKEEKLRKTLAEKSEQAIDNVISRELPVNQAEKLGIKPETVYERSYKRMDQTAKNIDREIAEYQKLKKEGITEEVLSKTEGVKKPIDIQPILSWIKNEINKIKKTAPSLSTPDKARLKILNSEYQALSKKPTPPPPEAVRLIDVSGKPFIKPKKGREPKEINASQSIDQTRNYNENVLDLYRKPEFTGAQQEVRETYAQLNDQFQQAIKKSGESDLARQLWFGNQVFSEVAKVKHVNNILAPAFENGYNSTKLASILKGKRNKKFLERNLGKNAVKDLIDIAHYGKQAEKMVFDRLKNPKTVGEYVSSLTPLKAGILLLKHGATAGLGTAYEIGKGRGQRIAGLLFTRPGTRKAYKDFLKGAISPNKANFTNVSDELTKAIDNEFGSEENLMKLSTQSED